MGGTGSKDEFADKLDSDLAHRTLAGTWGHPVTLILVFLTTTLATTSPGPFWLSVAAMTVIILSRIPLLVTKRTGIRFNVKLWRRAMILDIFLSAAVWGILAGYVCAFQGCESRDSTLLVLYISAVGGAGVNLLVQSVPLVVGYLAVLMGPLVAAAVSQGRSGGWLAVAVCFYFVYLIGQARRLNLPYWQQLKDNQELSICARRDTLTGLGNRLAFQESLQQIVSSARDNGTSVALLYIDLDGFKQINDRLSHRVGDLFLIEIATRLSFWCDVSHKSFRIGGDEFTVLLEEGTGPDAAAQFAQSLQEKFREPMILDGNSVAASASIGLSVFPDHCNEGEDLLRTADDAMYAAKAAGKGTNRIFRDAGRTPRFSENDLAHDMREALACNQFEVHYQPQVDCRGNLAGLEALLRWTHPVAGNIPPLDFIPLAEKTGLIVPLGYWILRHVCEQGVAWHQEGYAPVPIAVNVSPVQFGSPDFAATLVTILRDTGFPPSLLSIEITETTLFLKKETVLPQLIRIRDLGIRVAVDDFGTGYSSLSRLDMLPIDVIKLDRTFISAIRNVGDRAPIVEAIFALARELKLDVIAEGIEVPEQYEVLRQMGCEAFQGYYFGKASGAYSARHFHWNRRVTEVPRMGAQLTIA
jgi:diguanylate cyclase (GGDEF)-like protein